MNISIYRILVTDPMMRAVTDASGSTHGFKRQPGPQGFRLTRMTQDQNMTEPITVKRYRNTEYFEILDGRHRFVKHILLGEENIRILYDEN